MFAPFVEELTHDGFLEWGVMFQYRGVTEEVFVTSAKYVRIWTNDPRRAAKVLRRHAIPEVGALAFIDEYPVVSETLQRDGGDAGWSYVLERVTQEFEMLPRVYPPVIDCALARVRSDADTTIRSARAPARRQ